jgi:dTDP-4-amino-4,6-dideoxygalactose transaminase
MFYMVCSSLEERNGLIQYLKQNNIHSVFHYISLHSSPYFLPQADGRVLPESDRYTDCLVRLPLYYELSFEEVDRISACIKEFVRINNQVPAV